MNTETFIVQRQTWTNTLRYIIMTQHSSVQLEIYPSPQAPDGVTAYIWALWVDKGFRLKGRAARLLRMAEQLARQDGQKAVWLQWQAADTPIEVLRWYERMGYRQVSFNPGKSSMLKKELRVR